MGQQGKLYLFILSVIISSVGWSLLTDGWSSEKHRAYTVIYKKADKRNIKEYCRFINAGIKTVQLFFDDSFKKKFDIYIHPNRQSLDSQWQKAWAMPTFKSECWMVASGVSNKLDIISPKIWDKESCEHTYSDKVKTQQLITHELFHVYHGQINISSDFTDTDNIDWFVEGLATYASGQFDSLRTEEIKKLVRDNKSPKSLNDFWKGRSKYGLSGSVVLFIDQKYGRSKLKDLLKYNKKVEILTALNTGEEHLLAEWKAYFEK